MARSVKWFLWNCGWLSRYDPYASTQEQDSKNDTYSQYTALMELAKIENNTQNLEHV